MRSAGELFLLPLILLSLPAAGQEPMVSNVTLAQSASGSGTQVDIYYDLSSPGGSCTVAAYLSRDACATFPSPIISATGDIGSNVSPGVGKHIAWNIAADCPNETIAQACIRIVADLSPPDPTYAVGTHDITYTDPSRGNRSVVNRIRYPATWSGADAPVAGGPGVRFPVVVFGHGWLTPTGDYTYLWNQVVPAGYIMIMVDTETGALPDQEQFARDMAFVVDRFQLENTNPASMFYGKVAPASAAAGHSMGGGASIVATLCSASINTIVTLAAAENSAPVIDDAALVSQPALMISGASDCMAVPSDHQIPMYNAMPSVCKYFVSIVKGSHCQFCENSTNCIVAQTGLCLGRKYVARGTQESLTGAIMIHWLDAKLKGRQTRWLQFDPTLNTYVQSNLITYNSSCSAPVVGQSAVGLLETVPPSMISLVVEGPRSAVVTFSEAMFWPSTGTPANYTLTGAVGTLSANPAGVESVGANGYRLNWASGEMFNGGGVVLSVAGVQDARGNPIVVPNSASSVGAGVPPTAVLSVAPTVNETSQPAAYDFTIIYQDNAAVKASTLDGGDIRVTGPNGFNVLAAFVSVDPATGDASPLTVTYRIVPPGGTWDLGDNGLYMIAQDIGQVMDTAGNAAPAGQLGSFLVNFSLTVTVQSNPAGCSFTVDGANYTSTQTFGWSSGSSHTIATTSPQSGSPGTQYVWANWSDSGAMNHTVTATNGATYTASFITQYLLTTTATPPSGGTVGPASGYYNSGQTVLLSATAGSGFAFSGWTGTGSGSYTGSNPAGSVTMNGPINETANFTNQVSVTVQSNPAGCSFTVDGTSYMSAQTFTWTSGSNHTIATTSPQSGSPGTQYVWANWSDSGAMNHVITPAVSGTFTAKFTTQYLLTTTATPPSGGTVGPASGYYDSGQTVGLSATAGSGFTFSSWTGTGSGSYTGSNPAGSVTMNEPITETANFTTVAPTADFAVAPTSGNRPLSVQFTGQVMPEGQEVLDWRWDFGDGTVLEGDQASPVHVYTGTGQYTVTLTVTTSGGSATVTKQDLILVSEALTIGYVAISILALLLACLPLVRILEDNASPKADLNRWP